jgi:ATP-dependent helicase/nuclease subunit B
MKHRLYTGPFAALEIRWLDTIAELQKGDSLSPIAILVGSNLLACYLKQRIVAENRAAANLRFYTFLDLSRRLAGDAEIRDPRPRLPHLASLEILRDILSVRVPERFSEVAGSRGFQDALIATFRDLRDAEIEPSAIDMAARSMVGLPLDRRESLLDLADLFKKFRRQVSLFRDVDDEFRDAVRNASAAKVLLGTDHLLVYGIYDVTGQQATLLRCLKEALGLTCFVPFVDEAVSAFARPFMERCAHDLGVRAEALSLPKRSDDLGRMCRLEFGWVQAQEKTVALENSLPRTMLADGSFGMVSAPGESRMAVEIVREILSAMHEGAIAGFHEAAVLLRQPETQIPVLAEALRLRGIPYFIHGGSPFADRPLGKAVFALCELETLSFSRQAILNVMELIGASLPAEDVDAWDAQHWRALTNDPRFLAGVDSWDVAVEALLEETKADLPAVESEIEPENDEEFRSSGARSAPMARKRLEAAESLKTAWQALRGAAAGWPVLLSWKEWSFFLEQRLQPVLGSSGDWDALANVFDELAALDKVAGTATLSPQIPRDVLVSTLRESIGWLSRPEGRFNRSGVNLLSLTAARGLRFPLVLIPGLEEGRFPARPRQDPLLLDAERAVIGDLSIKSARLEEEKLLFNMGARSATKRLRLLTSRLDEDSDRERLPSQFFLGAAAAARGSLIGLRDLAEEMIPGFRSISLENPVPREGEIAVDAGEIRLRLITGSHGSRREALSALARLEPLLMAGPLAYDRSRWMRKLTEHDGRLADPDALHWISQRIALPVHQVSASRIEEYAKCPYLFFLRRIMNLDPWEEQGPAQGMSPLERGSAIHSILEDFLSRNPGKPLGEASPEIHRAALAELASKYLERSRPAGVPDLLWEIERDSLLLVLDTWLTYERNRHLEGLIPLRFEQPFGEMSSGQSVPPLRIRAAEFVFDFRGRIDRIDLSADGKRGRVIDYKTGPLPASMKTRKRTPLMSGERIQLVIYREALVVLGDLGKLESVEGEYLHLQTREGRTESCFFSHEELLAAAKNLPAMLEVYGEGIEQGVFFARTRGSVRPAGHCGSCDYLTICGKDREQREARKAGDPAVLRFLSIREIEGGKPAVEEDA